MRNASSLACVVSFMRIMVTGSAVGRVRSVIRIGWRPSWLERRGVRVPSVLPSVRQTNVSPVFLRQSLKEQGCVVFLQRRITAGAQMARKNERIR